MRISNRQVISKYFWWEENLSVQFFEQMWKPGVTQSSFVLQDPWKQKWEIQILIDKASRNIEYLNRHRSFNGCHRYLTMGAQVSWSASPSKWIVMWISKAKKREERTKTLLSEEKEIGRDQSTLYSSRHLGSRDQVILEPFQTRTGSCSFHIPGKYLLSNSPVNKTLSLEDILSFFFGGGG